MHMCRHKINFKPLRINVAVSSGLSAFVRGTGEEQCAVTARLEGPPATVPASTVLALRGLLLGVVLTPIPLEK